MKTKSALMFQETGFVLGHPYGSKYCLQSYPIRVFYCLYVCPYVRASARQSASSLKWLLKGFMDSNRFVRLFFLYCFVLLLYWYRSNDDKTRKWEKSWSKDETVEKMREEILITVYIHCILNVRVTCVSFNFVLD